MSLVLFCLTIWFCSVTAQNIEADFYIAPNGNDLHPGTIEQPFATFERAQIAVRDKLKSVIQRDIVVFVRGGVYNLEKPLIFKSDDGGTENISITYSAYPDEKPILSGGKQITGWRKQKNNLWITNLAEVKSGQWWFRQLFADGQRLPRGRYPNNGLLTIKSVSDDVKKIQFEENISLKNPDSQMAEVVVIQNWSISRALILSSDKNSVNTKTAPGWVGHQWTTAQQGKQAFLEHALEFVDQPGEWYLERSTGTLYYQAEKDEDPNNREFIAPVLEQLVRIEGTSYNAVRNLFFRGLGFGYTTWQLPKTGYSGIQACFYGAKFEEEPTYAMPLAIQLTYSLQCGFESCRITHVGASGLGLGAGCRNNKIVGCEFYDIGANGVMVGWREKEDRPPGRWFHSDLENPQDAPVENEISNCFVHKCGAQNWGAVGIFDAFSKRTRIANNLVTDLPYSGISIGFRWNTDPTSQSGCVVEYNHIHNVMNNLADGGGIYTLGFQPGTILRGNLIHDVHRSSFAHGGAHNNGVFLDQGSKGFLLEDNVIYNTSEDPIRFNQCEESWHVWINNSFGIRPDEAEFPTGKAKEAGLQSPFKDQFNLTSVSLFAEEKTNVIQLESKRELFVDQHMIHRLNGARLVLQKPHDEGPVLKFDNPWEGHHAGYCTVIKDDNIYRLYYRGLPPYDKGGPYHETTCYAESKDGIHWVKPNLGLFEVNGTLDNNVVLANADRRVSHNFSPFIDTKPGVDPNQRFKALGGDLEFGLIAYTSPDGIHWKKLQEEPVFKKGRFDSQNVSFWSESEQCYLCYFRGRKGHYDKFRSVDRTTSKDFIHWTEPVLMGYGDAPVEHIYTSQTSPYFRAPHIYIATAARFMEGRQVLTEEQASQIDVNPRYYKDCSDAVLMTTRGGSQYDRTFMEGFICPGIGLENWISRTNYPALNVVQTGLSEMSVYVNQDYAQPTAHLRRYSLRLDGFVSVSAPYKGGEMITKYFTFSGEKLHINFATSAAGEVRVEVQDIDGKPIPGYSIEDSQILIGNEIERVVTWKNGHDVSQLAGKPVRLRFVMKDADLYAMWFK